ncbi:MAG: chromosomal replication initiator protein DnaA [Bdellovibrionales bacterium]|nr:chromosomal replication initiator protein DnaA [Bdellovibrionales bacterium]
MKEKKEEFWGLVKSNLTSKNSGNKLLQTWFEPTDLIDIENISENSKRFKLGVPTELHKYWISENLFDRICSEISCLIQNPFEVELVVTGKSLPVDPESPSALHQVMSTNEPHADAQKVSTFNALTHAPPPKKMDFLNPEYTFSTFVVGRNNEFAHATSYRIAQRPGSEGYNPLFICGPTGMGKTHLLHAVGNHIRENLPHIKISYVSAERFLTECVSHIRRGEMDKFRQKYRERCDLLLMDDIHVLGRGEAVQEEFFHTLNHFFEKGRQVVVASDRMPKDIKGLEDRIRTRLEWGLIADIQMPELETRMAILRYKAEKRMIPISEEVATYIAKISKRSIRELEGNLNKVKMFSELQGLQINLDLTKKVLAVHDETTTLTVEDIQKLTAEHFKVRVVDLKSKNRSKPLLLARQLSMYLIKNHLDKSLVEIGRAFGGRDHTTVLNALRKMEKELSINSDLKRDFEDLQSRIHNITGV